MELRINLVQIKRSRPVFPFLSFLPPAMKLGQGNIFRSVCQEFCPQGWGGGVCPIACWDTHTHTLPGPETDTLTDQRQTPPRPEADTPRHSACWEIWATRGRYASYWNAYLLCFNLGMIILFVYVCDVRILVQNYWWRYCVLSYPKCMDDCDLW